MLSLIQDNSLIEKKELLSQFESSYKLMESDCLIGIGALGNLNKENMIFITIKQEYQGNGYGEKFFDMLLEESKKIGYSELYISIDENDIRLIRIVNKFDAKYLTKSNRNCKYVIEISK